MPIAFVFGFATGVAIYCGMKEGANDRSSR